MACSGSHCTSHGTGTTTCAGHRAACSTNRAIDSSLSGDFVAGGKITDEDVNVLRTNIRNELDRYKTHRSFTSISTTQPTAHTSDTTVDNTHINDLSTMVQRATNVREPVGTDYNVLTDPADATTAATTYEEGTIVSKTHWDTLKTKYDTMRQDCICNSDCSCNLVCSCHNNCGCNYSDERLKENIKFLGTKAGLNIYSWTYLWDKATTYVGVIAQELIGTKHEHALATDSKGYYMVNYNKLPI